MKISNPFTRTDGSKVWTGDTGRRVQKITVSREGVRQLRIHKATVRAIKAGRIPTE